MKWRLAGIIIILLIWEGMSLFTNRLFLPAPYLVVQNFVVLLKTGGFYLDIFATIKRTLAGLALGGGVGILLGIFLGSFRSLYKIFELPLDFIRSVPASALFPVFIVILGLGEAVKIFVAAWTACFIMLINTFYGIKNVSATRLLVAKLKRFSPFKKLRLITMPSALPYLAAGLRVSLSLALIVELVAEMFLGSQNGLGHRVYSASSILQMEEVYSSIVAIGLIGYALNQLALFSEKKIIHWR